MYKTFPIENYYFMYPNATKTKFGYMKPARCLLTIYKSTPKIDNLPRSYHKLITVNLRDRYLIIVKGIEDSGDIEVTSYEYLINGICYMFELEPDNCIFIHVSKDGDKFTEFSFIDNKINTHDIGKDYLKYLINIYKG